MTTAIKSAPDPFDAFWEEHKHKLPVYLRNDSIKQLAKGLVAPMTDFALREAAKAAATPAGVKAIISFARISAIVKGVDRVCDAPDPSPEQVADAVERLARRVKP